jgi:hypothetical protein
VPNWGKTINIATDALSHEELIRYWEDLVAIGTTEFLPLETVYMHRIINLLDAPANEL